MYREYFGLTAQPFRLTPDSGVLYMSEPHSRAKAYMDYTVWNREGFVVITGEIGCGKTTLIQKLLSELDENVVVAKVFQTQLNEVEFLQAMLVEFGSNPFNAKKVELLDLLNTFLIDQFLQRKQIVLIVDDAHNLTTKVLEEIRMLADLETHKEKILHVILVGQPQLSDVLDSPEMEQLMQRVKLRYHIRALSNQEQTDYIRYRLRMAGSGDRALFAQEALALVYKYTGGIPRLINTLCDTALTVAYADNAPEVTLEVVEAAVSELQWPSYAERMDSRLRLNARRAEVEGGARGGWREQSQMLAVIADQVSKLGELAPSLESVGKTLTAIEKHLQKLLQKQDEKLQPDSPANRRQKIG